jgi:dephospho-CoA kinase
MAFIEGAVILEAGYPQYYHEIWCASVHPDVALERLLKRNPEIGKEQAKQRILSQKTIEEVKKNSSFV